MNTMSTLDLEGVLDDSEDQSIVIAFDLYGTLLDTTSISTLLDTFFPSKGPTIAALWRRYQLEYTWRLNSMNAYEPFDSVTKKSLQHALKELSLTLPNAKLQQVLGAYDHLDAFGDVKGVLEKLKGNRKFRPLVFTNGTAGMALAAMGNCEEIKVFEEIPENLVSVNDIEKFKPHPMTYEYLAAKVGKGVAGVGEIVLVTANPFDVVGASEVGLKAVWLDRAGKGWQDGLGSPTFTIRTLGEIEGVVEELWTSLWGNTTPTG